jgi:hypothetical protein
VTGTYDEQALHLGHLLLSRVVGLLGAVVAGLRVLHRRADCANLAVDNLLLTVDRLLERVARVMGRNLDPLRVDLLLWSPRGGIGERVVSLCSLGGQLGREGWKETNDFSRPCLDEFLQLVELGSEFLELLLLLGLLAGVVRLVRLGLGELLLERG